MTGGMCAGATHRCHHGWPRLGPDLTHFSSLTCLRRELRVTEDNLRRWLADSGEMKPAI